MSDAKNGIISNPHMVGELAVYFITPDTACVIDTDCRYELTTTRDTCDCCTFRFSARRNPGFVCRHIKAVREVLGLAK